jgi:hypothetical protein
MENVVSDKVLQNTTPISTMEEFDVPPNIDELQNACGKDPGSNGIPADIVKAGKENSLPVHLHELLLQCWDEGTLPQDMRDVKIVTLYKNKGNYHGISLLSTMGKACPQLPPTAPETPTVPRLH